MAECRARCSALYLRTRTTRPINSRARCSSAKGALPRKRIHHRLRSFARPLVPTSGVGVYGNPPHCHAARTRHDMGGSYQSAFPAESSTVAAAGPPLSATGDAANGPRDIRSRPLTGPTSNTTAGGKSGVRPSVAKQLGTAWRPLDDAVVRQRSSISDRPSRIEGGEQTAKGPPMRPRPPHDKSPVLAPS